MSEPKKTWAGFRPTRAHHVDPRETDAMAFWQSRAGLKSAPRLADIRELARAIRSGGLR